MRIEQVTKYKCNGCHNEQQNPTGWLCLVPLLLGSWSMTMGASTGQSEDYCGECIKLMRAALRARITTTDHVTVGSGGDS